MSSINIEINRELLQAKTTQGIIDLIAQKLPQFNVVNATTALHNLAKNFRISHPNVSSLEKHGEQTELKRSIAAGGKEDQQQQVRVDSLLVHLSKLLLSSTCQPRHLSNTLWACGVMNLRSCPLEVAVLGEIEKQTAHFNPQELANTMWALGKLEGLGEEGLRVVPKLVNAALLVLDKFTPQGLSNFVWGLGNLPASVLSFDPSSGQRLAVAVAHAGARFNRLELTNAVWGIGKLQIAQSAVWVEPLCKVVASNVNSLEPRNLATIISAMTKISPFSSSSNSDNSNGSADARWNFLQMFGQAIVSQCVRMNGHELSIVCWGFASCCEHETFEKMEDMLVAVGKVVKKNIDELSSRQVATISWGFATVHYNKDRELIKTLAKRARVVCMEMNAQDLDNVCWSLARFEEVFKSKRIMWGLCLAIEKRLLENSGSFSSKNFANLIWALAKIGYEGWDYFFALIAREAKPRLKEFNARDLANAAWGIVMMNVQAHVPKFLRCVAKESAKRIESFNAQECSKLLWAMERSGVKYSTLQNVACTQRELRYDFAGGISISLAGILAGGRHLSSQREKSGTTAATGTALWDPSFVLSEWLARDGLSEWDPEKFGKNKRGKQRAIELGAGLGLCSITAAHKGFDVLATDGDQQVLSLLTQNIRNNPSSKGSVTVSHLEWGHSAPFFEYDLVLGSGLVYGSESKVWQSLLKTLLSCCGPNTVILLAHGQGAALGLCQGTGVFLDMLCEHFTVTSIPHHTLHVDHRKSCVIHALRPIDASRSKKRKAAL